MSLQASPRVQTDEDLIRDVSDKLEQGYVTESIFDAVQAKVKLLSLLYNFSQSLNQNVHLYNASIKFS